jgi:hypothetical protein
MAHHMALWHALADEPGTASLMAAAARDTASDFASSPLVRVMLERSLEPVASTDLDPMFLGTPERRERIRVLFLGDVRSPRGRAMARLDFTLAALCSLENTASDLPDGDRPDKLALDRLAWDVAVFFTDRLFKGYPPDLLVSDLPRPVLRSGLFPEETIGRVAGALAADLLDYVHEVCMACPVDCVSHPRRGTREAFESPLHPLLEVSETRG